MPQPLHRHHAVDSDGERPQHLTTVRPGRGSSDQHAAVGVGDQLDHAVVPGLVDPAPRRRRHLRHPHLHVDTGLASLGLGRPHGADLRVGERHPRQRTVVRRGTVLAQDVPDDDVRLVRRDVSERTAPRHVADGPQILPGAQPVIHLDRAGGRVEADCVDA